MTRRRLAWIAATLVLLLAAGYGVLWLTSPRHRINQDGFERIQVGMTESDLEAILGVPAGDYTTGRVQPTRLALLEPCWANKSWASNEADIYIGFDARGRVNSKLCRAIGVNETAWDKLRRWLGISSGRAICSNNIRSGALCKE